MRRNKGVLRCPQCGGQSYVTSWKPGPGLDPALREFICSGLKHKFYVLITDPEQRELYDQAFKGV